MERNLEELRDEVLSLIEDGATPGKALELVGSKHHLSEGERSALYDVFSDNLKDIYGGCARYGVEQDPDF